MLEDFSANVLKLAWWTFSIDKLSRDVCTSHSHKEKKRKKEENPSTLSNKNFVQPWVLVVFKQRRGQLLMPCSKMSWRERTMRIGLEMLWMFCRGSGFSSVCRRALRGTSNRWRFFFWNKHLEICAYMSMSMSMSQCMSQCMSVSMPMSMSMSMFVESSQCGWSSAWSIIRLFRRLRSRCGQFSDHKRLEQTVWLKIIKIFLYYKFNKGRWWLKRQQGKQFKSSWPREAELLQRVGSYL